MLDEDLVSSWPITENLISADFNTDYVISRSRIRFTRCSMAVLFRL